LRPETAWGTPYGLVRVPGLIPLLMPGGPTLRSFRAPHKLNMPDTEQSRITAWSENVLSALP